MAQSRPRWVQPHPRASTPLGPFLSSYHFLPHPGVPPTPPMGCSPLLDGALEPLVSVHWPAGSE